MRPVTALAGVGAGISWEGLSGGLLRVMGTLLISVKVEPICSADLLEQLNVYLNSIRFAV